MEIDLKSERDIRREERSAVGWNLGSEGSLDQDFLNLVLVNKAEHPHY